jgi:hypothetical protein
VSASASSSPSATGSSSAFFVRLRPPRRLRPLRAVLGVVGVLVGRAVLGAALALEDRVDEVGLAQAAVAVDGELTGEGVQVGEGALFESGTGQHGHDGVLLWRSVVGRRPARVDVSGRRPGEER